MARLDGEDEFEHRMREMSYLHLTRFVRILLDRKDRMSMAVGLEVRVPFCDHRLVEYVYNTPWSLKTLTAGRRACCAARPATCCPTRWSTGSRARTRRRRIRSTVPRSRSMTKDLYGSGDDLLFTIIDPAKLEHLIGLDPLTLQPVDRTRLERVLDLAVWIDMYKPTIVF